MRAIYLIHHNRPELLIAQIAVLNKLHPDIAIIVVLTCDYSKNSLLFDEFMRTINNLELQYILSDTNVGIIERSITSFLRKSIVNSIVLRTPLFRHKFGQDPSSGHARALNKVLKHSLNKPLKREVWILEGDVFPLSNFVSDLSNYDIYGSTTSLAAKSLTYFNGRVFAFKLNSKVIQLIKSRKLTFSSYHTCNTWQDTGSKTYKLILSKKINRLIKIGLMPKITDNNWLSKEIEWMQDSYPGFLNLLKKDLRNSTENCSFDLYDNKWLHIGKSSGYFKFDASFDFDKFCIHVSDFVLKQVDE
jgi:hypothetical protein